MGGYITTGDGLHIQPVIIIRNSGRINESLNCRLEKLKLLYKECFKSCVLFSNGFFVAELKTIIIQEY